jgi:hypothetical protein
MIYLGTFLRVQHLLMHIDIRISYGVKRLRCLGPSCVPLVLIQAIKVFIVNDGELALRQ